MEGEAGVVTEPVVASETMEREAPAEGAAEEPRGWLSVARAAARERRRGGRRGEQAEIKQAAGEAVGSLEFLGLWKETKQGTTAPDARQERLRGLRLGSGELKVRVALVRLVDELVRNKVSSGILAIRLVDRSTFDEGSFNHDRAFGEFPGPPARTTSATSGSASSACRLQICGDIRFADFDGFIDGRRRGNTTRCTASRYRAEASTRTSGPVARRRSRRRSFTPARGTTSC